VDYIEDALQVAVLLSYPSVEPLLQSGKHTLASGGGAEAPSTLSVWRATAVAASAVNRSKWDLLRVCLAALVAMMVAAAAAAAAGPRTRSGTTGGSGARARTGQRRKDE
jgi:hypothetical protein